MKAKIVHCVFTMETGGAQVLIIDLLNRWCAKNYDVSLIIVNAEYNHSLLDKLNKSIKVYKINRKRGSKNPLPLFKLNTLLWKLNPDVVHCHETNMVDLFLLPKFKTVLTIHDVGKTVVNLKKYDSVIAISRAVANDFNARYSTTISFISNGINVEDFKERTSFEVKNDTFKLVQLSRLMHEKKGQDVLIKSLVTLLYKYNLNSVYVDFIGPGPSLNYLKELVGNLDLNDRVTFLGEKDRAWINKNLSNYDILVQPSIYEGFGLTVAEGIASGIPVVASNIEGPAEILNTIEFSYLFDKGSPEGCADKIKEVIDLYGSGEMAAKLQNSISKLKSNYSVNHTADSYMSLYQSIIK